MIGRLYGDLCSPNLAAEGMVGLESESARRLGGRRSRHPGRTIVIQDALSMRGIAVSQPVGPAMTAQIYERVRTNMQHTWVLFR
jgi:hypothetical protein